MADFKKENDVYEFEGTSEFEKYYNEDSFYGAFNISTNSNLPHSQTYNNEFGGINDSVNNFVFLFNR